MALATITITRTQTATVKIEPADIDSWPPDKDFVERLTATATYKANSRSAWSDAEYTLDHIELTPAASSLVEALKRLKQEAET